MEILLMIMSVFLTIATVAWVALVILAFMLNEYKIYLKLIVPTILLASAWFTLFIN